MNFTCPYCNQITTITAPNHSDSSFRVDTRASEHGHIHIGHKAIACPNQSCRKLFLEIRLSNESKHSVSEGALIKKWSLLPQSAAKPQPDYIPNAILEDYYEACAVLNLSPKASATLSRRCLQGIVRDYWSIPIDKSGKLGAELSFIKDKVDPDTWEGIQAIRSVGDIGAHMEKDVNYVVDVEDDEAELLIELIEMLFVDWYVSRQKRQERATRAKALSKTKLDQKKAAKKAAKKSEQDEVSKA